MAEPEGDLLTAENQEQTTQNWRDGVADEYREGVSKFETPNDLAKGYLEIEKLSGSKIKLPTPESSAEEVSAFYDRVGRPANADGYELPRPDMPEGMTYNEDFEKAIRSVAYEAGISKAQLQALSKAFNEYQVQEYTNFNAELQRTHEEGERVLKEKWGAKYDENLEVARRACKELGDEDFTNLLVESKLGNNPVFIKAFHNIGMKILNDTLVKGEGGGEKKDEYVPAYKDSPGMYANDTSEEGEKARAWFKAHNIEVK